jgi:hypothetical protein
LQDSLSLAQATALPPAPLAAAAEAGARHAGTRHGLDATEKLHSPRRARIASAHRGTTTTSHAQPRWSQTYGVNPLALCQCGFWLSQQLLAVSGELLATTPELRPVSFLNRKTLAKSAKTFRRFEAERPNQI